ncbi:MAG: prepilin-type N-terminal cleavage/methylation domain-containing protein [candidate division NC10 bacterium]|nr:prepilin-type N-terminal cleavage/methylation domain-containing protein [candidate division NC10 bacterium]
MKLPLREVPLERAGSFTLIPAWVGSLPTPPPGARLRGGGPCRTPQSGFTLLEVLLALALLSLLLGALYSTFFLSHKAMEGMDESLVKLQECRMALDTLCREIESAADSRVGKDPLFKIEDRDFHGKQTSRLTFRTFSPLIPGASTISYYVEEREGRLTLLKRLHSPYRAGTEEEGVEVVEDIAAFLVEAWDGSRWVKTWDVSETRRFPVNFRIIISAHLKDRQLSFLASARPQVGRTI